MADFVPNHRRTWLEKAAWAAKVLFLTVGIASTAVLMARFAVPYLLTLLSSSLPKLWDSLVSWFAPPYLFITVHFIIMVIWKLHGNQRPEDVADDSLAVVDSSLSDHLSVKSAQALSPVAAEAPTDTAGNVESTEERRRPWPPPEDEPDEIKEIGEIEEEMDYNVSSSPDGIDATWRAIMNGKSSPVLKSQLKKSDTWERTSHAQPTPPPPPSPKTLTRAAAADSREFSESDAYRDRVKTSKYEDGGSSGTSVGGAKKEMRKSKTFRESTGAAAGNAGWRGRDVLVVGRDELFGKVEAFIKMNYDQMRVQRQEAQKQRYVEMVNAAY